MPLYIIERTFAEQLDLTGEDIALLDGINADEGVRWLFSFLSADKHRTYCLYEAPSPEAIRAAARRSDIPVDAVVEVGSASADLNGRLLEWAGSLPIPESPPSPPTATASSRPGPALAPG